MNLRNPLQFNEVYADPSSPAQGQMYLKAEGVVGSPGQAMGCLGITYAHREAEYYGLKVKTNEGTIAEVSLFPGA